MGSAWVVWVQPGFGFSLGSAWVSLWFWVGLGFGFSWVSLWFSLGRVNDWVQPGLVCGSAWGLRFVVQPG